ncbi:hypothetical protein DH2020_017109 [Rehmannia glutinosa]|uniref:Peptidase A1 domain-containing protein n=1 Tax=Rehmannia glutinosa TaxID=99300 RepID=A0ABR0WTM1_REHGL
MKGSCCRNRTNSIVLGHTRIAYPGSTCSPATLEFDQSKHQSLHLPLYHIGRHGPDSLQTTPSFSEALSHDVARVKFLNSRLTKKNNLTTPIATKSFDGKSAVSVPLNTGESIGVANYYTKIGIGTPPTYHIVVVDTGSSFSWIQCEPCSIYCHPQIGSRFDPSASNTYQKLSCAANQCTFLKDATLNSPMCTSSNTCLYTATYGDQSFSVGYLSKDSLTLGTESLPNFTRHDNLALPTPVYSAFREEMVKIISSKYKMAEAISILDACFVGSSDEISTVVPSVQLMFQGGAELNLEPQNVVIEVEKGTTCLSFAGNSNTGDIGIIGNQQQQTFDIVYDIESSRIGFAASGCR